MASKLEMDYLAAWQEFTESLEGVTEDEARAYRLPNWPAHPDFAGEDGSIGGVLQHNAAWQYALAVGVETGSWGDEKAARADDESFAGRLAWAEAQHERLLAALRRFEAEGMEKVTMDGKPYTVSGLYNDTMAVHDRYHAAQINYLRQRYKAEFGE